MRVFTKTHARLANAAPIFAIPIPALLVFASTEAQSTWTLWGSIMLAVVLGCLILFGIFSYIHGLRRFSAIQTTATDRARNCGAQNQLFFTEEEFQEMGLIKGPRFEMILRATLRAVSSGSASRP